MSKLFENKQLIHIASELILVAGVSLYFYKQNKNLSDEIEELSNKLEEQDETIKKHDIILKQLLNKQSNNLSSNISSNTQSLKNQSNILSFGYNF